MARARRSVCREQVCATVPVRGPGRLRSASDVCTLLAGVANRDRESFYAIPIGDNGRAMGVEEVGRGTLAGVPVAVRDAFRSSIALGAKRVIFAHNHPSGASGASGADTALTDVLRKAGEAMGVEVLGHVIVARGGACGAVGADSGGALEGAWPKRRRKRVPDASSS